MKFIPEKLGGPFFRLRIYLPWGYSIPSLVWFEQLLDPIKKSYFKIPFFREIQNSVWKIKFFPRQAILKILFVLHSNYTGDTPCRVLFDLNNTVTRWKRPIFKIPFSRNSKCFVWNTNFFPRQAIPKIIFVLHSNYTGDTPCRVWFDLNTSLTR